MSKSVKIGAVYQAKPPFRMPDSIPTGRFNHATLNCKSARRSVAFYRDVLGFKEAARPSFSFVGAWLYRDGLGMMLHLNEDPDLPDPPPGPPQTRLRHLAFGVEDFDQALALLQEHGLEVAQRTLPDHGYRQAFFHDPDGNLIELGEWPDAEEMATKR